MQACRPLQKLVIDFKITPYENLNIFKSAYLLSREDQPLCSSCACVLTVVHLLIECPLYTTVRRKYFSVLSMAELFDTIKATNILAFIREIGFYHHI